jgi:uncharacterized protein YciI
MIFFVHTLYKPDYGDLRDRALESHRAHFDGNLDKVLAAGNLSSDDGRSRIGGVALLDVADRAAAEAFMAKDPFTEVGLIDRTTIVRWNKVYFDYDRVRG